jgi:glycosyltransferase involved in cell wall biosynthesis
MLEAMSTGCAVIASDTAPVKEVIQDNYNGFLVDFFSPSKIADKVDEVLGNFDKTAEIRKNARDTIINKYNLKNLLPKHVEIIKRFNTTT